MPVNVVKNPEQERLWAKAKRLAEKQGRGKDYAYVMGIFKQMGALDKAYYLEPSAILPHVRVPGQVPDRDTIEAMRLAKEQPRPLSMARLLEHTEPRPTVSSIVSDLGFDLAQQNDWTKFLEKALGAASNELTLRQDIMSKCLNDRLDGALRRAILQRSLVHWRGYRKSMVKIVTPIELKKAEARGGSYHRRVPTEKGYRYYYDEQKYKASKSAHTSGLEATESYLTGKIQKCIEAAGKGGCGPEAFSDLVKRYGAKVVGDLLNKNAGKLFEFQKGRFMPVIQKSSDTIFYIPESMELRKAYGDTKPGHKYLSRKRDPKGNWTYTYPEDLKTRVINGIIDFLTNPNRELTVYGTAKAFKIDNETAGNILNSLEKEGKIQKKGNAWIGAKSVEKKPEVETKTARGLNIESSLADIKKVAGELGVEAYKNNKDVTVGVPTHPDIRDIAAALTPKTGFDRTKLNAFMQYYRDSYMGAKEADKTTAEEQKFLKETAKEEPKLVIPKKPKEQLDLFGKPKEPTDIDLQADKSIEETAGTVVEEVQKPDSTAVSEEELAKPEPPQADDATLAYPLSSSQIRVLNQAATEGSIALQRIKGSTKQLIDDKLLVQGPLKDGIRTYIISELGKKWLADENKKPPKERTPKVGVSQKEAEEKADKKRKVLAVEQGDHVWGSRADIFSMVHTTEDLAKLTPEDQARYATKKYCLPTVDIQTHLEQGKTPGYVLLRRAIESCIQAKSGNNLEARQLYMDGTTYVSKSLDALKTENDVKEFLSDFYHLCKGRKKGPLLDKGQLGAIEDAYLTARGEPPKADWKERERIRIEYETAISKWRNLRYSAAYASGIEKARIDSEVEKARIDMDKLNVKNLEVAVSLPMTNILLWHLQKTNPNAYNNVQPYDIDISFVGDKYQTFIKDPDLGRAVRENPYARMAAGLGERFVKLVAASNGGYYAPKVYKDAVDLLRTWDKKGASESDRTNQLLDLFKEKKRNKTNKPKFEWEIEVSGQIRRKGGDPVDVADPKLLANEFGFSNVQFGNWVTEEDANSHIKGCHGALRDLADITGMDKELISINGKLAIGFGARGSGPAKAHYEPSKHIINLTKMSGGGSLAHEWAHAIDNLMSKSFNKGSTKSGVFMSEGDYGTAPPEVIDAYQAVLKAMRNKEEPSVEDKERYAELTAKWRNREKLTYEENHWYREFTRKLTNNDSEFYADAKALSGPTGYWSRTHEMFARCFAVWAQDKLTSSDRESTYLVYGTNNRYFTGKFKSEADKAAGKSAQPFPHGKERDRINDAIENLVKVLRETNALRKALEYFYIMTKAN